MNEQEPKDRLATASPPLGVIYVHLRSAVQATSSSLTVRQSDMDKEVSPIPDRIFGTRFRWQFVICRYHWLSFARN